MPDDPPRRSKPDPAEWARVSEEELAQRREEERQAQAEIRAEQVRRTERPIAPDWEVELAPENEFKDLLFALSLAFAALGLGGLVEIAIVAYYVPLGAGAAGLALLIIAATMPGRWPWYAWIAGATSIGALALGIAAYGDYKDTQEKLDQQIRQIQQLQQQLP